VSYAGGDRDEKIEVSYAGGDRNENMFVDEGGGSVGPGGEVAVVDGFALGGKRECQSRRCGGTLGSRLLFLISFNRALAMGSGDGCGVQSAMDSEFKRRKILAVGTCTGAGCGVRGSIIQSPCLLRWPSGW
jgi:hypothetical protein